MHSGTIEHMCINPDGPLCYCGNRGCLETYCSANSLEHSTGLPIKEFFPLLREKNSPQLIQIWEDYLNHLAFAMKNLNLIIDAPIIISGYLAPYFTETDIDYLLKHINSSSPFTLEKNHILVGVHGQYTLLSVLLYFLSNNLFSLYRSYPSNTKIPEEIRRIHPFSSGIYNTIHNICSQNKTTLYSHSLIAESAR